MSPSSETAVERRVALPAGVDLHARPAGALARAAMGYAADVAVVHGDREADAKSVLRLMALGAEGGAVLIVRARGADAEEAAAGLTALLETLS
jgi:phosphotransferase system HPr (HPr) family protein